MMLTDLPPEVIDHVCTFLDLKDIRTFHAAPFANHPVYSRCVTTLVYKSDVLKPQRLSFEEFVAQQREINRQKPVTASQPPQQDSGDFLREAFERYKHVHHQQSHILAEQLDFTILQEVVPRFSKLQCIVVSARDCSPEDGISIKPFDDLLVCPGDHLKPYGSRHVSSLLQPLSPLGQTRLSSYAEICRNLTSFEQHLDVGADSDGLLDNDGSQMIRYKAAVGKGSLRRLLGSTTELQVLRLGFTCADSQDLNPAAISDFLPEDMHWKNLQSFVFQGVESTRQDMVDFVRRHGSNVTSFHLHNFRLVRSSWLVFIPELRNLARENSLGNVWLSGTMYGEVEEGSLPPPGLPVGSTERFELGHILQHMELVTEPVEGSQ
ncbi:hypothetical protein VPNG_02164 [Cytospora leucostoma]|uniref:F-box domain-containing protein n=1 Tax=Cytospora leucostoma TaxID=1230097 RepID=A0A423XGY1_9PEZI|nr:hypothetical protein VPNG_02164 [Cytospora leucostoma]